MRILCFEHKDRFRLFRCRRELGALLGQRQIRPINGAGNMGLMSAVSDAALRAGGEVTGGISRSHGGAGMASHRTYPTRGSGKHARTGKDDWRL